MTASEHDDRHKSNNKSNVISFDESKRRHDQRINQLMDDFNMVSGASGHSTKLASKTKNRSNLQHNYDDDDDDDDIVTMMDKLNR